MNRYAWSAVACLCWVASTAHAETANRVAAKSIAVSGTSGGKAFSFTCVNPPAEPGGNSRARRVGTKLAAIKCIDPATHFESNATLELAVGKQALTPDESNGFMSFAVDRDVISTTPRTPFLGKATTEVTTWDDKTGHLVGRGTLAWDKDKLGQRGNLTVAFDLVLPP